MLRQPERRRKRSDHELRKQRQELEREWIARRAYEVYLARGGEHGHDLEDWLQAERELRNTALNSRSRR